MLTEILDYLSPQEENAMQTWARDASLGIRERAQLNAKLDLLERTGFALGLQLKYVGKGSGQFPEIFQVVVRSERRLRPLLCRESGTTSEKLTLLGGYMDEDVRRQQEIEETAETRRADMEVRLFEGSSPRRIHERF